MKGASRWSFVRFPHAAVKIQRPFLPRMIHGVSHFEKSHYQKPCLYIIFTASSRRNILTCWVFVIPNKIVHIENQEVTEIEVDKKYILPYNSYTLVYFSEKTYPSFSFGNWYFSSRRSFFDGKGTSNGSDGGLKFIHLRTNPA